MTDYSKLSDFEINSAVSMVVRSQAENPESKYVVINDYCNNPADAWPIIVENKISVMWMTAEKEWCACPHGDLEEGTWHWENVPDYYFCCESQLRAAMVCFLMAQESNHANS